MTTGAGGEFLPSVDDDISALSVVDETFASIVGIPVAFLLSRTSFSFHPFQVGILVSL
jgi:hypothetical protein